MKKLAEAFDALKIEYTEETLNQFKSYMEGVIDWNEKVNLTAITEHDEFIVKHFIENICFTNSCSETESFSAGV